MNLRALLISALLLCGVVGSGCEGPGNRGGGLLGVGQSNREQWTIHCLRIDQPGHQEQANRLADMLRAVQSLDADKVRVASDATGSTIYYGQYAKVTSRETGRLAFPPEYLRDLRLIQQLAYQQNPIFRFAKPELIEKGPSPDVAQWDVANATGKYTLQVGVFYNTPTFQQRKQAAEDYVKLLREDGFNAYFRHEAARSFVFVGDFEEEDIVKTPKGRQFGPNVERLIARREEEFRHMTENGYLIRKKSPDGQMIVSPSMLIPTPRKAPVE